jgi:phospholipid/cholesterol/gamma-HCH transport system ATP-binding protein
VRSSLHVLFDSQTANLAFNRMNKQQAEGIVKIENLSAYYAERKILDGINLDINRGEIMAIMGGSGAGKSTLLRHMLGLMKPASGSVYLFGQEINNLRSKELYKLRQKMGVAFQGGALLTSMTVGDNVALPLKEHTKLDENTIRIMVRMKLEMVGLSDCEQLMPAELSGGMLKRAALARAVVMDPRLLFFDEPSSGLDPISAVELDELILQLKEAMNMTIVVITHELQSALAIADRITVLAAGKTIFTGTVAEVKQSNNAYIQDFLNRRVRQNTDDVDDYLHRLTRDQ